jgi:hypothetical protein
VNVKSIIKVCRLTGGGKYHVILSQQGIGTVDNRLWVSSFFFTMCNLTEIGKHGGILSQQLVGNREGKFV